MTKTLKKDGKIWKEMQKRRTEMEDQSKYIQIYIKRWERKKLSSAKSGEKMRANKEISKNKGERSSFYCFYQ